jgi:hypothetical protein
LPVVPIRRSKLSLIPSANHLRIASYPVPLEGRFAIVTDVGRGAVAAKVSTTNDIDADGEVVWS